MNPLDFDEVCQHVNKTIVEFHEKRLRKLSELTLSELVEKNPYLFRAKNITSASQLIESTMSAFLSSSEEKMFGDFLEDLAIFIAERTLTGHKSGAQGVDLEFNAGGCHYFVSIKSGPNWGNASQHRQLGGDLQKALNAYRQGRVMADAVLGICYGKARTSRNRTFGYLKLVGQNFWTFISGNRELYKEVIEPIGFRAREHNDEFKRKSDAVTNRLVREFVDKYCDKDGVIDWAKLIEANSGNYDLDKQGLDLAT